MKRTYTSEGQLRAAFWEQHPQFAHLRRRRKRQNQYPADVRMAWVDFNDAMHRDGHTSDGLASRATL